LGSDYFPSEELASVNSIEDVVVERGSSVASRAGRNRKIFQTYTFPTHS